MILTSLCFLLQSPLSLIYLLLENLYLGIDGTLVNARAQNRFMEAKVGIVFSHQLALVGTNRPQLLNKQYVGTLQSVQAFSQQLFTMARSMSIDNQEQLVILSDGDRWINKLAPTQYPKATLILDWWRLKRPVWPNKLEGCQQMN